MDFLGTQFLRKKREYHCIPHSNASSEEKTIETDNNESGFKNKSIIIEQQINQIKDENAIINNDSIKINEEQKQKETPKKENIIQVPVSNNDDLQNSKIEKEKYIEDKDKKNNSSEFLQIKKLTSDLNFPNFDDTNDYNLFNYSYLIVTKFVSVLKNKNDMHIKEKLISELLKCVNETLNSNKKEYKKIKYGMDNLYSRTLFYNFLHYFSECLKSLLEEKNFTLEEKLKDYDLFVKCFNEKTNHYFKFMTNYNNHIVDLLKKELFIYIFVYRKMLTNPNIYECFNINPYSRKFYSNNLISIVKLKGHVKSKLFTETLWYLLGIQNISIGIDDIRDMVENELNNTRLFYVPLPIDMLSFSLVNGSILINERFSYKTFQDKKEIQAKAIILVLFLSEFANIITRKSFKEFDDKNYFEKNYYFDCKQGKDISCFNWMYSNLFGGITDFYYCNSKFIIDIENYKGYYKNFNEFRDKLNEITTAPDTHYHCKNVEIYDPSIATESYYK